MKFIDYNDINARDETAFDTGGAMESYALRHPTGWSPSTVFAVSDEFFLASETEMRINGWLLYEHEDPETSPLLHKGRGWVTIDNDYNLRAASPSSVLDWIEAHAAIAQ